MAEEKLNCHILRKQFYVVLESFALKMSKVNNTSMDFILRYKFPSLIWLHFTMTQDDVLPLGLSLGRYASVFKISAGQPISSREKSTQEKVWVLGHC